MNEVRQTTDDAAELGYALDHRKVGQILGLLQAGEAEGLAERLEPLHPADIADLLEQIDHDDRRALIALLPEVIDGEVLSELDEGLREEIIRAMPADVLARAVRDLESDDVVDLVEDLDEAQQNAVLDVLAAPDRVAVELALSLPEFSAGRLMQREVVMAPEHWTVGNAIDFMRLNRDLPEQFYHVILVDPRLKPVAYVALGRLMSSRRDVRLADLAEESFRVIPVDQSQEDVAYAFNQYHLITAPVVDGEGRLVGMITIDDAMTVLDEEHEEDIMRLAGVGEGSLTTKVIETTRRRFPWLAVNLVTAIAASLVIDQFEATIAAYVALAVLMPIVASMGGNAGTQSLTVAVRAIATRDLTGSNVWRVIRREVLVGVINGVIFAVVMGFVGALWFSAPLLGVVIGAAMIINLVVAGLAGVAVPVILERLKVDPALASGAFVTTVTDVVGFFAFLGLASMVLL